SGYIITDNMADKFWFQRDVLLRNGTPTDINAIDFPIVVSAKAEEKSPVALTFEQALKETYVTITIQHDGLRTTKIAHSRSPQDSWRLDEIADFDLADRRGF